MSVQNPGTGYWMQDPYFLPIFSSSQHKARPLHIVTELVANGAGKMMKGFRKEVELSILSVTCTGIFYIITVLPSVRIFT